MKQWNICYWSKTQQEQLLRNLELTSSVIFLW